MARLTLLGSRAVLSMLEALRDASDLCRVGILQVLEAQADPRALPEILALLKNARRSVALKALSAASAFPETRTAHALAEALSSRDPGLREAAIRSLIEVHRAGIPEALEPLLDQLLDDDEEERLRLLCLEALLERDSRALRPILKRLDKSPLLARAVALWEGRGRPPRSAVAQLARARPEEEDALLARIAEAGPSAAVPLIEELLKSPEWTVAERIGRALRMLDPEIVETVHEALPRTDDRVCLVVLSQVLAQFRSPASIPALHRLLERLGTRDDLTRAEIHLALATLGSRIALYDLRDMLEDRRAPFPLLKAAERVGDATLIPGLAALVASDPKMLKPCAAAFKAIAQREGLTRRSGALRSVKKEHRRALERLWSF